MLVFNSQKGISLVITFLVMTIILAIVLSISVILYTEIKIIRNIGDSVLAFYAAETGTEQTLYFDRKQIPPGATRGFCNICNICNSTECASCEAVPLDEPALLGCDISTCSNCQVTFNTVFDTEVLNDKLYAVNSTIVPDPNNPGGTIFSLKSKGFYKETTRAIEVISTR